MSMHTHNLMEQLVKQIAHAVLKRMIDQCINLSKAQPPVQHKARGLERHWDEIKEMAHFWGGPTPFEFGEVERTVAHFFHERLRTLPSHEQATLVIGLLGVDEFMAHEPVNREPFRLPDSAVGDLLNMCVEALISFVSSGQAPEDYEADETDELFAEVEVMKPRLNYLREAHYQLAHSHAFDIRQNLVTQLRAEATGAPAFEIASEGCRSHWDEICVMAHMGGDHILYGLLMSTLDESALRLIKELPEVEKYALWAETDWGLDWIKTCDWEDYPVDLHTDSSGLQEAARTVRQELLSSAAKADFFHDEIGEQAQHNEEDDVALLEAVANGTHPLMLEPELAEMIREAYLRRAEADGVELLFKRAVDSYTAAMLSATEKYLISPP